MHPTPTNSTLGKITFETFFGEVRMGERRSKRKSGGVAAIYSVLPFVWRCDVSDVSDNLAGGVLR